MKTENEFKDFFNSQFQSYAADAIKQRSKYVRKIFLNYFYAILSILVLISFSIALSIKNFNWENLSIVYKVLAVLVFIAGVSLIAIFFMKTRKLKNEFSNYYKNKIVMNIVKFIDKNLEYNPNEGINAQEFSSVDLFNKPFNRYFSDDLIEGTLDKTHIKFCEIHAWYEQENNDKKDIDKVFDGLLIKVDFNKNFKGKTYVLPDKNDKTYTYFFGLGEKKNTHWGELIKLEDIEFEKEFAVFADDQIEARFILSTSLMRRLIDYKRKVDKKIRLAFINSWIYLAIPFKERLFEPNLFGRLVTYDVVVQYYHIIQLSLSIVDELNLNTRIWGKE